MQINISRIKPPLVMLTLVVLLLTSITMPQAKATTTSKSKSKNSSYQAKVKTIEKYLPGLMLALDVPGVSIAMIEKNEVVWAKGYGVLKIGEASQVNENSVLEACSMSKPLFGYAVLKLVEQKKIDLDRPLVEYLAKPYAALSKEPEHKKITARMVLAHTTGLRNWRKGGWRSGNPIKMLAKPGEKYTYSGEGFLLLQRAVEAVTKEPMGKMMLRDFLRPMKMSRSSYIWVDRFANNFTTGHDQKGKPITKRGLFKQANAAYTLYTTPTDYAKFMIEMMKSDRSASHSISRQSIADMLKPESVRIKNRADWGLGWGMFTKNDRKFVFHTGANGTGFRCMSRFEPQQKSGIVIMTNSLSGTKLYTKLMKAIDK